MTHSSRNTVLVALLAAALGHGAAWVMMPRPRDEEILRALERLEGQSDRLAARLAEVQTQLRELEARPAGVQAPPAPLPLAAPVTAVAVPSPSVEPAAPAPSPLPTPANQEALARGHQLLDRAISSRRWGHTEVVELRELMAEMNGPQRAEVMQKLAAALNRGDIQGTLSSLLFE